MSIRVHWKPHPGPQTRALMAGDFEVLMGGARGGGKTDAGMAAITWPFKYRRSLLPLYRVLVIRKNSKDLQKWLDRASRFYHHLGGRKVGTEIRFDCGALITTGHLKDVNAYTQYIGNEYDFILIEELTLIPREMDYVKLISSCRSTVRGLHPQVFCTTNPGEAGHVWVAKRWNIIGKPPYKDIVTKTTGNRTRIFIPSTVDDNPTILKIDPEYVQFLDGLEEPLKSAWRYGDWSVFMGQFFGKLSPLIHAMEPFEVPQQFPLSGALDYGETAPTAFGLYTEDGHKTIRIGEYYVPEKSAQRHAENIKDFIDHNHWTGGRMPSVIYADPSMWTKVRLNEYSSESPADQFIKIGLNLVPANNDRINGWRACRRAIDWHMDDEGKFEREPSFAYFADENPNFEILVPTLQTNTKGNPEDVLKCSTDHIGDEWRYKMIATKGTLYHQAPRRDDEIDQLLTKGIMQTEY